MRSPSDWIKSKKESGEYQGKRRGDLNRLNEALKDLKPIKYKSRITREMRSIANKIWNKFWIGDGE